MRSARAAYRRAERESRRQQRELERELQRQEKLAETERVAYEVAAYENYIDVLRSVHKECGDKVDWEDVASRAEPVAPTESSFSEEQAQVDLREYTPSLLDRLLRREESKRTELEVAVEEAKLADRRSYERAVVRWEAEKEEWAASTQRARQVLEGDRAAQIETLEEINPFAEISELGSSLELNLGESGLLQVTLHVHSEEVVPSETKSQLKSGRLSTRKMPVSKFNELFQDYVCGCVLRVANEVFSVLPVDAVIVNAVDRILNSQTGYRETVPILSAFVPRQTLQSLNLQRIDPSDSMKNFVHRMEFKKTRGFSVIEALVPADIDANAR